MATVRAATQAMARRQERLTGQTNLDPQPNIPTLNPPSVPSPLHPFNPIATSSPEGSSAGVSVGVGASGLNSSHLAPHPLSPTVSEAGSTLSLPDEASWLRHQHYVAPEKLQIVKPLEGSVTLLKWKLLASPQLGGATSFFSDASRPGVHVKGWKAAGIVDKNKQQETGMLGLTPDVRVKSLSTGDLSHIAPPTPSSHHHTSTSSHYHTPTSSQYRRRGPRRGRGIHSRVSNLTTSTSAANDSSMNAIPEVDISHDQGTVSHDQEARSHDKREGVGSVKTEDEGKKGQSGANTSLLQQVGNFFSWSRLGMGGSRGAGNEAEIHQPGAEGDREEVDSPTSGGGDMGLAGIL